MPQTHKYTICLHALNDLGVLPRITLHFSRRRLKIDRFEMVDAGHQGLARFNIVLGCDAFTAEQLIKQLQKIIGLQDISVSLSANTPEGAVRQKGYPSVAEFA